MPFDFSIFFAPKFRARLLMGLLRSQSITMVAILGHAQAQAQARGGRFGLESHAQA